MKNFGTIIDNFDAVTKQYVDNKVPTDEHIKGIKVDNATLADTAKKVQNAFTYKAHNKAAGTVVPITYDGSEAASLDFSADDFAPVYTSGKDLGLKLVDKGYATKTYVDNQDALKLDKAGGSITGNLTVGGNLTINGTTTTVDSTTLQVKDKLIEVAHGNTATLTTPAGLVAPKYDGTNSGALVFDSTGTAYVGDVTLKDGNIDVANSDLQPLATRTGLVGGNLVQYDSSAQTLNDSGKKISDLALKTDIPTNYVTTDTDWQEITSTKKFFRDQLIIANEIDIGASAPAPEANQYRYIDFLDKNDKRIGIVGASIDTNKCYGAYLQAGNVASMGVMSTPDGFGYSYGPIPPNKDNTNKLATTSWTGRRYKSISDFGFTSQTTVKAIVQKIIDNWYEYCTFACTNDNFNNFSDTPDGYGTLIIEVGSNALRPLISFTKQIGDSNSYKHWQANIVRGANNQVTEIQWYQIINDTLPQTISGAKTFTNNIVCSKNYPIIDLRHSLLTHGAYPSETRSEEVRFLDKDDYYEGGIRFDTCTDGTQELKIMSRSFGTSNISGVTLRAKNKASSADEGGAWILHPSTDGSMDLGASSKRWRNGYITNLQNCKVINGGGGNSLIQQNSDTSGADITVGSDKCPLKIQGKNARPVYRQGKGSYNNIALQSDIPKFSLSGTILTITL